jgi:outer membrane receptor protein involved in Fe transport
MIPRRIRSMRAALAVAGMAAALGLSGSAALGLVRSGAAESEVDTTRAGASDLAGPLAPSDSLPLAPEILVTAPRWGLPHRATAASVAVLDASALEASAALTIDDALRQVPGFTLFRRSGSGIANPTTQGVSLRALGGSGASRALVLFDGIPLNDPFGGWIPWSRLSRVTIDRIEVSRGGGSDLYGNTALGGVIHVIPRRLEENGERRIVVESAFGHLDMHDAALCAGARGENWSGHVAGTSFATDGHVLVAPEARGAIDTAARSRHTTLEGRLERRLSPRWRAHAELDVFEESRGNGTPFQENGTRLHEVSAGVDGRVLGGEASGRAHFLEQRFHQSFSAIEAGRESEQPTRMQNVPAIARGGSLQWRHGGAERHRFVIGSDLRDVRGTNEETALPSGAFTSVSGRQRLWSAFAAERVRIAPRVWIAGGARFDAWENLEAARDAGGAVESLAARQEEAVSPQASIFYAMSDRVSLWAAAYEGFRAPTLNELYRSFRVGDVVTLANDRLEAETLVGREIGVKTEPGRRVRADATLFSMNVEGTIANVTIRTEPDLITRERQNLGEIRSRGVELDLAAGPFGPWMVSGGYLYADSPVLSFPANPELEGRRVPQTPPHQITMQCRYLDARGRDVAVQARWQGEQFDDDQNRFRLAPFFTLDVIAAYPLTGAIDVFAAAENLLDQRYEVGRTPVLTLGPPRAVRVGVKLTSEGKR